MAKSVRASLLGHEYQHLLFWIEACRLFIGNPPVGRVGLESGDIRAFDDVVTDYAGTIPDAFLRDISGDHYQCKFHVAYDREIRGLDLADPKLIHAKRESLLERLADATREGSVPRRMTLVSAHRIDRSDPLRLLVSPRDGEILADPLFSPRATKEMVAIRGAWMSATGAQDENALRAVLAHLRIKDGVTMDMMEERLDYKLAAAGLVPVDRTALVHRYGALAETFIAGARYHHDRAALEALLRREGLFVGVPAPNSDGAEQLGIKSFAPFAYDLEDEANVLNLLRFFHGRHKAADVDWNSDVLRELEKFLTSRIKAGARYDLHLDTHLSIAFAAGELTAKAAAQIVPVQRFPKGGRARWTSTGAVVDGPLWEDARTIDLGGGPDTAFAIEVTWPVADDVALYVKRELPEVGRIVVATVAGGPNGRSVRDGDHGHALADTLAEQIRRERGAEARLRPLHLFASAPASLMFLLGRLAVPWGLTVTYEFDFGREPGAYAPAFHLPPKTDTSERS